MMFAMTTFRYVVFLASFLVVKTETIDDKRLSPASRLFQRRDLSPKCPDITPLLTKLISDLENLKYQIFHGIPELLEKQGEETKQIANEVHTVKGEVMKQVNDLRNIQTSVEILTDRTWQISRNLQLHDERLQNFKHKVIVSPEENLALGRPATQSSTLDDNLNSGLLSASRAVDGNYSNDHSLASFSCSHNIDGPGGPNWWRVKLDRPYHVQKVVVTNRKDCCAERLDYFIVGVTNSMADPVRGAYPLCGQYPSTVALGATVTLNCDPDISAGQYVIIQQPSNGTGYFTLCEVEVYARTYINYIVSPDENLALGRPATQSSTYQDSHNGVCDSSRAVDGNYSNDHNMAPLACSVTLDRPGGPNWWRVQLDRPYRVQKVVVTNRQDCCADRLAYFIVGVTNSKAVPVIGAYPLCGQYPSTVALGATVTLNCDPDISAGQYVIIQQPSNGTGWLTLCEVEVYAKNN